MVDILHFGNSSTPIGLQEGISEIRNVIRRYGRDSFDELGKVLARLGRNRDLLPEIISEKLVGLMDGHESEMGGYSANSIMLWAEADFAVRANIWPAESEMRKNGGVEDPSFSYGILHDHNFDLLTYGYSGPGYESDFYEYSGVATKGLVGEKVKLENKRRVRLEPGKCLFMKHNRDIHVQLYPEETSVSLNILLPKPGENLTDAFEFGVDPEGEFRITRSTSGPDSIAIALVKFAEAFDDPCFGELISSLAQRSPRHRARWEARAALARMRTSLSMD